MAVKATVDGKEVEVKGIMFICDRKACNPCNPECTHTARVGHAIRSDAGKFRYNYSDKRMWQTALPDTDEKKILLPKE